MDHNRIFEEIADASVALSTPEEFPFQGSVCLYGAGNVGRKVAEVLAAHGVSVEFFVDQNAAPGAEVMGLPVVRPDDPCLLNRCTMLPIVVTIFNPYVNTSEVIAKLKREGWKRIMSFVTFHRYFHSELGDHFWLTSMGFYRDHLTSLRRIAEIWADEESRSLYAALLAYRLSGNVGLLPSPDIQGAYFPDSLPPWSTPVRLVDCGAFDGDTLDKALLSITPPVAAALFEPDPANFVRLSARVARYTLSGIGAPLPDVLAWPCAVHSETTTLRFSAGQGTHSAVCTQGEHVVQAVALDQVLAGFQPTLMKMDIEGGELKALLGARNLIHRHRPGLAICVYHRPDHLWRIPELILSWNLGYRFFLRSHGENGFEVVVYGVPAPHLQAFPMAAGVTTRKPVTSHVPLT